ncbi:MAG: transcriptional regulator with GAF, ATPase, and Fis domain, partial [Bradymonadia bacterium]
MLDATTDLQALTRMASDPHALTDVLDRALLSLSDLLPYDLAAVLELDGTRLRVRAARGRLADDRVRAHCLDLGEYPTIRRALELRRPIALTHDHHASAEGDPYDGVLDLPDGHACMVVPLFAGDRDLGVITLDRSVCVPYDPQAVHLAGVIGQVVALAIACAEQARASDFERQRVEAHNRLLAAEAGVGRAIDRLTQTGNPAMLRAVRMARQVAITQTPVLLSGERGVGKRLLAQAIHTWSPRRAQPFVTINCAAILPTLLAREIFGPVGRLETARGGTLLLDEIEELPLDVQAMLMQRLQIGHHGEDKPDTPVGGARARDADVRILAATAIDLSKAVTAGRFRADLYDQLDIFAIHIPPLRDRLSDLAQIAAGVLLEVAARTGRGPWSLAQDTLASLTAQAWPGNVRQLRNALERATILRPKGAFRPDDFALPARPDHHPPMLEPLDAVIRAHISSVLRHTGGRIYGERGAARILGLKPS